MSRKHREVETRKGKIEGMTKEQERKTRGDNVKERKRKSARTANACGIATYRRFRVGTDLSRSPASLVFGWSPRFSFVEKNSTADDERNAIGSA